MEPSAPNQASVHPHAASSVDPQEPNNKKRNWLLFAVFVVVIAAGLGLYLVLGGLKAKTATAVVNKDIPLLRVGILGEDLSIDHPRQGLVSAGAVETTTQVFEGLVRYKDINKIEPLLATSWSNPDNTTWIFELKKGVQFHTGRTMTAADVKKSIEALKNSGSEAAELYVETVKTVEVMGDYKVKITTTGPDPIFLNKLPYVFVFDSQSTTPNSSTNGTGPYMLKPGSTPTVKNIQLVAFNNYHNGHIHTRELEFKSYSDGSETLKDFREGKLDITTDLVASELETAKAPHTYTESGAATTFIAFNQYKSGPSQNKLLREALQYVADKAKFIKDESLIGAPAGQIIPPETPGYNPEVKAISQPDVAKAKVLLTKAGYPNGVSLSIAHGTGYTNIPKLQEQFAKAGITLNAATYNSYADIIGDSASDKYDLLLLTYSSSFADGLEFFVSPIVDISGYKNEKLNTIITQSSTEFDPAKRLKLLKQGSQIVADESMVIPMLEPEYVYAMNKPYVLHQDMAGPVRGVFYAKVYTKE